MFSRRSTQFYNHRDDERVVDQSSLNKTRLDSHDISKKSLALTFFKISSCESSCKFTSSSLFLAVFRSRSIFVTMIAKVVTFDRLISDLYAAASIIAMFIESKDEDLTELDDFTILLNEDDFSLSRVMTEEIDLFSI